MPRSPKAPGNADVLVGSARNADEDVGVPRFRRVGVLAHHER